MDNFGETYNLLKQNHEELENLNRPITRNEIESVIKNQKSSTSFTGGFCQTFKKEY